MQVFFDVLTWTKSGNRVGSLRVLRSSLVKLVWRRLILIALCASLSCLWAFSISACELCAIYRATNARGESSSGFLMTLSEQFVRYGTLQFEGERYQKNAILDQARMDTSLTHIVPAYNFSEQFGVSLNIPIIYRSFHRVQLGAAGYEDETGTVSGVGDASLIGRDGRVRG